MRVINVECTAEINQHIGTCTAAVAVHEDKSMVILFVYNKYGGELHTDQISNRLYREIIEAAKEQL